MALFLGGGVTLEEGVGRLGINTARPKEHFSKRPQKEKENNLSSNLLSLLFLKERVFKLQGCPAKRS